MILHLIVLMLSMIHLEIPMNEIEEKSDECKEVHKDEAYEDSLWDSY